MKSQSIVFVILLALITLACKNFTKEKIVYINTDDVKGSIIADTIIYDVIIKNTNPEDYWTDECLQYLNKQSFVDSIFDNIYNNLISPVNFFTGDTLSISDVKALENVDGYSRESIGKIQFYEVWYFDSKHMVMNKEVLSMVIGVEKYNNLGELKGYKPLFRIYLN